MVSTPSLQQSTTLTTGRFLPTPEERYVEDTTLVSCGTSVAGLSVRGFVGPGELILMGSFSAVTPTSGAASGLAGVGTTSTSLVKPTGAANWTSSDSALLGKFVCILTGSAASTNRIPTLRVIKAVSTTAITIDTASGLSAGDSFDIVDAATVVTNDSVYNFGAIDLINNQCKVSLVGLALSQTSQNYLVYSRLNRDVSFYGCKWATSGVINSVDADRDFAFALNDCTLTGGAQVSVSNGHIGNMNRLYLSSAYGITIDKVHSVTTAIRATSATGTPLTVKRANNLSLGLNASNGAATACLLETVLRSDITELAGSSNTGFGIDVSKGGVHNFNGASITGSLGDFAIDGLSHASVTWANSASYGAVSRWGTTILVSGGSNTRQELDTLRIEGNFDIPASGYVSGTGGTLQLGGRVINYGYFHLDQDDSLTAFAGGGQANATALGFGANVVTTCATGGDSVKLPAGATVGGNVIHVKNLGAASCNVFPPSGGKINALATNTAIAVAAGSAMWFVSRNDGGGGLNWVTQ